MNIESVPQEGNATLGVVRKAVYARDRDGRVVLVASRGWEVEEIVTRHAVDALRAQADAAHARVLAGESSPLAYWMYARRMDLSLLSQTSGVWRWRVRQHLRPAGFARLSPRALERYADALGIPAADLEGVP